MAISRTSLPREFRYMETTFGLTGEQEWKMLLNSIEAAFTDENTKETLREALASAG